MKMKVITINVKDTKTGKGKTFGLMATPENVSTDLGKSLPTLSAEQIADLVAGKKIVEKDLEYEVFVDELASENTKVKKQKSVFELAEYVMGCKKHWRKHTDKKALKTEMSERMLIQGYSDKEIKSALRKSKFDDGIYNIEIIEIA